MTSRTLRSLRGPPEEFRAHAELHVANAHHQRSTDRAPPLPPPPLHCTRPSTDRTPWSLRRSRRTRARTRSSPRSYACTRRCLGFVCNTVRCCWRPTKLDAGGGRGRRAVCRLLGGVLSPAARPCRPATHHRRPGPRRHAAFARAHTAVVCAGCPAREAGLRTLRRACTGCTSGCSYPRVQRLTGQTLTVFLDAALSKKYTNPSSDIISVLAGLHDADAVLADFVAALDKTICSGRTGACYVSCVGVH